MVDHPLKDEMGCGPLCIAAYLQHDQVALALLKLHLLLKSGAKSIEWVSYHSTISSKPFEDKLAIGCCSGNITGECETICDRLIHLGSLEAEIF